jgi:hypothetical protein
VSLHVASPDAPPAPTARTARPAWRAPGLALALVLGLTAGACSTRSPETREGEVRLRAFLETLRLRPGDGGAAGGTAAPTPSQADVARSLLLTDADIAVVFGPQLQGAARNFFRDGRKGGLRSLRPFEPGAEIFIVSATTEELARGDRVAANFPRGWAMLAARLPAGQRFYHVTVAEPGKKLQRLDELTFVNGHWVLLPKVWRVVSDGPPGQRALR